MAYRKYVVAVLLFVAVAGIGIATLEIADSAKDGADRQPVNVTNESIVQEVGLWQFTNKALEDDTAGFRSNVTVFNSSDHELVEGTDYEWNETDGTVTYFNTQNVTDGNTGNISYTYLENTRQVSVLSRVIDPVVGFVSWSPLLVGGLGLAVLLLAAAAIVTKYVGGSGGVQRRR